ncbi:uncharacterized protein LOC105664953 [Ceratitis capitata]|uniref:uncharacterized protein LOC105664953 n=1 Tax=Ceratitis capitata TaxID=7213 RepID=UPI00061888DC|nr:uncharacterized protein LOC105664953 [Ceratitis capitata]
MLNACRDLDKLSAERKWDDVFNCLKIDVNSTIELGSLQTSRSNENTDKWLDDYKATMNSLEVILAIILFFDQIFYLLLLWYVMCFAIKFIRFKGLKTLWHLVQRIYSLENSIQKQNVVEQIIPKKKRLRFAKGSFLNST